MHIKHFSISILSVFTLLGCKENSVDKSPIIEIETMSPEVSLAFEIPAQLGEGAIWDSSAKVLYWVDILGMKLNRFDTETSRNDVFELPSRVGTVVPQTDSTVVVALEDGIYIKNLKSNNLLLLSDVEKEITGNRFNDGKCDPNGNLWVGSMDLAEKDPNGKLYRVAPDGETMAMLENVTISNGIVWTKDGKTMYYIDTPTAVIRAFDFDMETSTISNERVAVKVSTDLGFPDGMTIDSEDKLWVGMWNGNGVVRFDPLTGEILQRIEVPAHNVTSCAFGGPEYETLYITTASVDMSEDEKQKYPLAGSLFKVEPGVKGLPSSHFGTTK